ncbi:DNA-binding IclR family transcriptional regulator [Nocardia transvalensis]|uniref:DNA-binding IclR family transcriptional regulator n=1 Tax=Nocardia transvalensis TaxID=37333 RepID=A0A7W9UJN6_9NOCA|nr:helix-turn-helix domain-containing protein [Nocardia transvalensis]MBB5915648.1 DNA-binding IclR family transcriptional regulator [Nocardia transvalensis]
MVDDHTVIGRAVAILDAVTEAPGPLVLAELTRRTGIPKPTVRRIANDLVERDMLARTPDGYLAGRRLLHQGLQSVYQNTHVLTVQPYLQDLHRHSRGEMAWFAIMNRGELTVAGAAFGRAHAPAVRAARWPGSALLGPSIVLLASGRLQLAHQPERADAVLAGGWPPLTRYSVTDRRRMRDLLVKARDTGFAREDEQSTLGWSCLGAVLRDGSGAMIGAIGLTGRCGPIDTRGLESALRRSAQGLERELRSVPDHADDRPWDTPTFHRRAEIGYSWPAVRTPVPDEPTEFVQPGA